MKCHAECVYLDPNEKGGPVCEILAPHPIEGWIDPKTNKPVHIGTLSICVHCDHLAGCHAKARSKKEPKA